METNDNAHDVTIDRTVYQTIYAVKDGANGYISDRIWAGNNVILDDIGRAPLFVSTLLEKNEM